MEPVRFGIYTLLGAIPFTVALIYAGMVLRSNWGVVRTYFTILDLPLVALVVLVAVFLILQIVGVLEPGWPPRRTKKGAPATAPTRTS
jgi:membrane protein DedA with SNARE-associated domain